MSEVNKDVVVNFSVSVEEANVILSGLGELPAKYSTGLINKLQAQASTQLQSAPETPPSESGDN